MRQEIEEIMSKVRHRWRMKSPTLSIGYRFDLVGHKHERVARGRAYERGLVTDNNDGEELLQWLHVQLASTDEEQQCWWWENAE
jgi:hypothetical protein